MSLLHRCTCGNSFVPNHKCNQCGIIIADQCFKCHNGTFIHNQNRQARRYSIPSNVRAYTYGAIILTSAFYLIGVSLAVVIMKL